jgi:tetratricopeptide (TPR) repeat protein
MKKVILACAVLAAMTASAQKPLNNKSVVSKAETALNEAKKDPKNVNYEKLAEAQSLIEPCLSEGLAKDMPKTWFIAGNIQSILMNKMLADRQANDGKMDFDAFFDNQYKIVKYFSECDRLEHTPNEKGKMPKEEYRPIIQPMAKNCRNNLRNAGGMLANSNPAKSIEYINYYIQSADFSIFQGLDDVKLANDTTMGDINYYLATAYKVKGDTLSALPILDKALASKQYGKYACGELAQYYQNKKDKANARKYIDLGFEKYSELPQFGKWKLAAQHSDGDIDGALATAAKLKQMYPDDDYAYLLTGQIYFEKERFQDAEKAFLEAKDHFPDNSNCLVMAARSAWMHANRNTSDKAAMTHTIDLFKQVEAANPEDPSLWGESLYILYNNSNQMDKAKLYKKYYNASK